MNRIYEENLRQKKKKEQKTKKNPHKMRSILQGNKEKHKKMRSIFNTKQKKKIKCEAFY
jgi:hypothetical protein